MGETLAAWLEGHAGREDAHAHQALQAAKLITTFSAAFAATFVATALAEGAAPSGCDEGAVAAMALALVGVLAIVCRARKTPGVQSILQKASSDGWPDDETVKALRQELSRAAEHNKRQTDQVRWMMLAQVLMSVIATALAVVSLHASFTP